MKHKISELEGVLLDAAVAKAEMENDPRISMWGDRPWLDDDTTAGHGMRGRGYRPSTDPRDGWPIIEREHISIVAFALEDEPQMWRAFTTLFSHYIDEPLPGYSMRKVGPTALIAAMRAYLASSYGDEVELP